jgi:hypothetical protein
LAQEGAIKGLAHITGGGLLENIPRVLPQGCHAVVETVRWELPPLFALLQDGGRIAPEEMARTFNCGIGMAVVVSAADADAAIGLLSAAGELVWMRVTPDLLTVLEAVKWWRTWPARQHSGEWVPFRLCRRSIPHLLSDSIAQAATYGSSDTLSANALATYR